MHRKRQQLTVLFKNQIYITNSIPRRHPSRYIDVHLQIEIANVTQREEFVNKIIQSLCFYGHCIEYNALIPQAISLELKTKQYNENKIENHVCIKEYSNPV